jgi:O-antigen/teichoic acid export membrane protein
MPSLFSIKENVNAVSLMMAKEWNSSGWALFSGSLLRVANLVAAGFAALFLMPLIVHHVGDRLYGFWSLAAGLIGYYGLLDFGLSSAVSQYICIAIGHKDPAECSRVFNAALRIQMLLGSLALIATAIIAAGAPWFCRSPSDAGLFWKVIIILGLNAAVGFPVRVYGGLLDATLRFDIQSWLTLFGLALRTGLSVWAVLAGGGLLALAWITLIASVPVMALQIWFAKRQAPWARIDNTPTERSRLRDFCSYSVYTFVTNIADTLRFEVDALVISAFVGLAGVTHYRVASVFTRYYVSAVVSTIGTFQPVLSRLHGAGDQIGIQKVFFFATRVSLCVSIFLGMSLICWGRPFIGRWMGPEYDDAHWPLMALSLAVMMDVCQNPSILLLYATFNHRWYTYVNISEGIINLFVSLMLVKPLGILGVALGTLIAASLIRIVVQPFFFCRSIGLNYVCYLVFLGKTTLLCSSLATLAIAISAWGLRASYPYLFGSAFCATAIYAIVSWLFVFSERERVHLRAAISNRVQRPSELSVVSPAIRVEG